jgi:hypothetical protein
MSLVAGKRHLDKQYPETFCIVRTMHLEDDRIAWHPDAG